MIKFWKKRVRKKIQELEEKFIDESNFVDEDLMGLYYYHGDLSSSFLFDEEGKIKRLKERMSFFEKEYKACFCFFYSPYPNYEKFRARSDLILYLINKEFLRRYN